MWTQFWDMHSGGGTKERPYEKIYIEAPAEEAKLIFFNRFGHNPERVSCTCCGEDYSITEGESFDQLTAYHRNCKWVSTKSPSGGHYIEEPDARYDATKKVVSLRSYCRQSDVLVIRANKILDRERTGQVAEQGYVWKD